MSGRRSIRAALGAYIRGKDRVRERETKLGEAASLDDAASSEPAIEFGGAPAPPRFGVAIPERLEFHRGPATRRGGSAGAGGPGDA